MPTTRFPLGLYALVAGLSCSQAACSLFDTDFEGSVNLLFSIDDPDNSYQSVDLFDPNENDDFSDNRDRIKEGTVESMEFTFVDIRGSNRAGVIFGSADIRPSGDEMVEFIETVPYDTFEVGIENSLYVPVPADRQELITELVFEADEATPLEIQIDGGADTGPVAFDIQVRLNMVFTAGL